MRAVSALIKHTSAAELLINSEPEPEIQYSLSVLRYSSMLQTTQNQENISGIYYRPQFLGPKAQTVT